MNDGGKLSDVSSNVDQWDHALVRTAPGACRINIENYGTNNFGVERPKTQASSGLAKLTRCEKD